MGDTIRMPTSGEAKQRRRARPIAGQPVAPVLRLVVNNEHLKSQRELEARRQVALSHIGALADCILAAAEILAKIDC